MEPLILIGNFIGMLVGDDDDDMDWRTEAAEGIFYITKNMVEEMGGGKETVFATYDAIMHGIPSLVGIDLSKRIGLNNLLFQPTINITGTYKEAAVNAFISSMGVFGSDVLNMISAADKYNAGNLVGAFEAFLPKQLKDLSKAIHMGYEETTTASGAKVLGKYNFWESVVRGATFTPSSEVRTRESRDKILSRESKISNKREALRKRWLTAKPDARAEINAEIRAWNARHNETGIRINMGDLYRAQNKNKVNATKLLGGANARFRETARELPSTQHR